MDCFLFLSDIFIKVFMEHIDRSLIVIGIYQLLLFSVLLFFYGHSKTTSKKILAVFFLTAWVYYLTLGMYYLGNLQASILLYHLFVPALLAICPLFYLYVKSLTDENFAFNNRKLLHFLPSLIFFLVNTPVFAMLSPKQSEWFIIYGFTQTGSGQILKLVTYISYLWNFGAFAIQIVFYFYLIIKEILQHKKKIREVFSNLQQKNLNWLIWCTIIFFALLAINNTLLQTDAVDNINMRVGYNIAMILITAFLGLAGLRQIDIYDKIADVRIDGGKTNEPTIKPKNHNEAHKTTDVALACANNEKYVAPMLSETEEQKIIDLLENIMLTKKLFLNPELKITDVANEVSLPRRQISRAVNEKLHDNFYNFVNRYRIGEAKRLLEDVKFNQFSIEGIANQSGFNSRSSFYTAFKNETGVTPNQFREKVFSSSMG